MSKSYTPPAFSNFGKSNLFQTYDKDSLDHTVKQVTRNSSGVVFEHGLVFAPKSTPRGYIKTNFGVNGYLVDAQVQTDAAKVSNLGVKARNVLPKTAPGLNVGVNLTSSEKDFAGKAKYGVFATVNEEYTRNNLVLTTATTSDLDQNHSVSASAAVGFEGFALGGDIKFVKQGDASFQAKSYNAGVAYTHGLYTAALVSDSKFEKLKATVVAQKFLGTQLTAGVQAKVDLQAPKSGAPQREVVVGVEQKASPQTTYRLAVVAAKDGAIVGSIEHRLANPSIALTASAVTALPNSTFAPFAVSKFGVGIAFGDY